jgi:hypothetical protein
MALIDPLSENFKRNGLWNRLLELVGGDEQRAIDWWDIPIGAEPFVGRTPRHFMTDEDWDVIRVFLESKTPRSGAKYDYGQSGSYYYTDLAKADLTKSKRKR